MTLDRHLSARVLLVDDDADEIRLLERLLSRTGYSSVGSTTNPADAIARYQEAPPDLVILDLNMPGLNGLEVLERLAETEADNLAPVLMLTGETDMAVRVAALERGARDFLSKPFNRQELLARVRNLVAPRLLYTDATAGRRLAELSATERDRQLRQARIEMMRRLAATAESRDGDTGDHLARVARYAEMLGRAAGLVGEAATHLELAAPLHDVGKIAIPDAILNKPARLDGEEQAVMRTHTTIGGALLRGSQWPELQLAERIALTHHERWDGSGYPAGLAGAAIPFEGRVCALVDVFDALTSSRPYKRAWTVVEAAAEIQRMRGRHFDPDLVGLFTERLDAFAAARQQLTAVGAREQTRRCT
jgi:putative two-component system response regulator